MPDLKDDLAALRIEREPQRAGVGRWIGWAFLLLAVTAAGLAAWNYLTAVRPVSVETAKVSERAAGTQAAVLNASGYVTARRRATVSAKITGKVVEVNVEEGMAIREGQVLARLDDATSRAALALADAQSEAARRGVRENEVRLAEARVSLGRVLQLVKDQLSTQAEVDRAQAEVDSLDARIGAAREQVRVSERQAELERTNLDNTVIRAPFSGVAISKDAQPGEMVSPVSAGGGFTRTGICTIVDMRSLEIEVDVNEAYINRVRDGQRAVAVLDAYPDWQIPARVITTVPAADRQKATVKVRLAFDQLDRRILPDMGVKVSFLGEEQKGAQATEIKPRVLIPRAAVRQGGGTPHVFVVNGDHVERRAIRTGPASGEEVAVESGLSGGEQVVVEGPEQLAEGHKVKVRKES